MTTVKQIIPFDLAKMGTEPGWCEKNVRLGYDLPAKLADAKADMEYNRDHGMLHPMDTLPKVGSVPVFVDTPSVNEHIEVSIDGVLYSDGKKVENPASQKYFGWGESCATVRVVEIVPDPVPAPEPKEEPIKEGDIVVPIQLVDYNGTSLRQYDDTYVVTQLIGDRAVLSANRNGQLIVWAAMNVNNIRKA